MQFSKLNILYCYLTMYNNISSMHLGEYALLIEHSSLVKTLLVTRVTPKAKYWDKFKAQGLANDCQEKQGLQYSHQRKQNSRPKALKIRNIM